MSKNEVYDAFLTDMMFLAEDSSLDDDLEEDIASLLSEGETDKCLENDIEEEEVF